MEAVKGINCREFGQKVIVYDLVGKYGDWLFKQPIQLALEKEGFDARVSQRNKYPPISNLIIDEQENNNQWALVYSRRDKEIVNNALTKQFDTIVEVQRFSRISERVIVWRHGVCASVKSFRRVHEQERVRAIAEYLNLSYQERPAHVVKPMSRAVAVNLNVSDRERERLQFDFNEIRKVVSCLRIRGYELRVIKEAGRKLSVADDFYEEFNASEVVSTNSFDEACRVVESCGYYFGADSGLAHHAVANGKVVFSLFSRRYHGEHPLFQSTFRNHLRYFGDLKFSDEVVNNLDSLVWKTSDPLIERQINDFLVYGMGVNLDPYSNECKLVSMKLSFAFQQERCNRLASEFHSRSASIFFTDEIMEIDVENLVPVSGQLFINSQLCVSELHRVFASEEKPEDMSFYAKPCSFFYGTAVRDGSSDVDFPTVFAPALNNVATELLLEKLKLVLEKYGFCTGLPHQTPVVVRSSELLIKRHLNLLKAPFLVFMYSTY